MVTTHIGIEGIEASHGHSVLYGETPRELANLTIKLIQDRKLHKNIATNAKKLVEEKYTYTSVAAKLDAIYREVQHED